MAFRPNGDTVVADLENTCEGGFNLSARSTDGVEIRFAMRPRHDPGDANLYYRGEFAHAFMEIVLLMRVESETEAVGTYNLEGAAGGGVATGTTPARMKYLGDFTSRHYACSCREQLEAWLEDRISETEAYRAAWADPALRERPANWPAQSPLFDYWGPRSHKRMVDMVVAGYSPERAAKVIWNNTDNDGQPIDNDFTVADGLGEQTGSSASGVTKGEDEEYYSVSAAYVDAECKMHLGDAHKTACYPDIALQATIEHEKNHIAQCKERQRIGGLEGQADREVEAYAREAEFWRNWLPENCD